MSGVPPIRGTRIKAFRKRGVIEERSSHDKALVRFDNGETRLVDLEDLAAEIRRKRKCLRHHDSLSDKEKAAATEFYKKVKPLLGRRRVSKKIMDEVCQSVGLHRTTIQNRIRKFQDSGSISALIAKKRPGGAGKSRLSPKVEAIVKNLIDAKYLKPAKITARYLWELALTDCTIQGLPAPHYNTIRNRIRSIPEPILVKKRDGHAIARRRFSQIITPFRDADDIYSVIQIDHSPADIVVVDEDTRRPLSRPTLTVGVDVHTGMFAGIYLSLNPPSIDNVGICIYRCITPKESWLKRLGVDETWSIWGYPERFHVDNAMEFRSQSIELSLMEIGIEIKFRTRGRPESGGKVESYIDILQGHIHTLPGTTYSNPDARGEYDSNKNACYTLKDLEKSLVEFICKKYHKIIPNNGFSPEGYLKHSFENGRYKAEKFKPLLSDADLRDLRIRCLPMQLVTVQQYGIQLNFFHYRDSVLNKWVGLPNKHREDKKFVIRYDPSESRSIYFLDPDLKRYFEIKQSNPSNPRVTTKEMRAAITNLKAARISINENAIVANIMAQRKIQENAVAKSKAAKKLRTAREAAKPNADELKVPSAKLKTKIQDSKEKSVQTSQADSRVDEEFDAEEF